MSYADDNGLTDYEITGDPNMLSPIIRRLGLYKRSVIDKEVWAEREREERLTEQAIRASEHAHRNDDF